MPRNSNRGGRNNNPTGRNQFSGGVLDMARERPLAAAAAAAGAAAAGLFLWSKRTQITDQLSNLSDQIGEWRQGTGSNEEFGGTDDTAGLTTAGRSASRGMSETGGGNASLGRSSGGGGTRSSASGRGRVQSAPTS